MPVNPLAAFLPTLELTPFYIRTLQLNSYVLDTGSLDIPASEALIAWIRNDHASMNMIYWGYPGGSSFNGGDTNHDRAMLFRGLFAIPEPTANFIVKPALPVSGLNPNPAPCTCYVWDGVGAGMTAVDNGVTVASQWVKSISHIGVIGAVCPPGMTVGCSFEAEEAGKATDLFFLSWIPANQLI